MASLGVNIDHIANVRQARRTVEPDPVPFACSLSWVGLMASRFTCVKTAVTFRTGM